MSISSTVTKLYSKCCANSYANSYQNRFPKNQKKRPGASRKRSASQNAPRRTYSTERRPYILSPLSQHTCYCRATPRAPACPCAASRFSYINASASGLSRFPRRPRQRGRSPALSMAHKRSNCFSNAPSIHRQTAYRSPSRNHTPHTQHATRAPKSVSPPQYGRTPPPDVAQSKPHIQYMLAAVHATQHITMPRMIIPFTIKIAFIAFSLLTNGTKKVYNMPIFAPRTDSLARAACASNINTLSSTKHQKTKYNGTERRTAPRRTASRPSR